MRPYLVDGTYELFRHFYGAPRRTAGDREVGAVVGVVGSLLRLIEQGGAHLGVATDQVIESFRNQLWPGYKTGEGVDPVLWSQAGLLEEAILALGVRLWPMVEFEADDALASAAARAAVDPGVAQVVICTPDKDLCQCVQGDLVVQLDRRRSVVIDEEAVVARFGIHPRSIPDYLALVGDSADGFPGIRGWGPASASAVLARYEHLEGIPADPRRWEVAVRRAPALSASLESQRDLAYLFRRLATLRSDLELFDSVDQLRWRGPMAGFDRFCSQELGAPALAERAQRVAQGLA